jgi:hypothetical protein
VTNKLSGRSSRHFLIFLVVLLWPALVYAHGGVEAFVLQLAIFGYIISAVISLLILRPCSRIVRIIASVFSIISTVVFIRMLYTDWWRLAQSALSNLIFCMPLAAIMMRLLFRSNPKSRETDPSEK